MSAILHLNHLDLWSAHVKIEVDHNSSFSRELKVLLSSIFAPSP